MMYNISCAEQKIDVDVDDSRIENHLLQAPISNADFECKFQWSFATKAGFEQLWPLASRDQLEHAATLDKARDAFSSSLRPQGRLERLLSSILRLQGGSTGTHRVVCGSGADSSGTRRAFCGPEANSSNTFWVFCGYGAGSSGHFEPAAAPGRARAAISISSELRLRARPERPYAAN